MTALQPFPQVRRASTGRSGSASRRRGSSPRSRRSQGSASTTAETGTTLFMSIRLPRIFSISAIATWPPSNGRQREQVDQPDEQRSRRRTRKELRPLALRARHVPAMLGRRRSARRRRRRSAARPWKSCVNMRWQPRRPEDLPDALDGRRRDVSRPALAPACPSAPIGRLCTGRPSGSPIRTTVLPSSSVVSTGVAVSVICSPSRSTTYTIG